ncbi:uncharacterized protein LOC117642044 isoform X3 [Thrips palmi]|uniref:Uncharacterized protein LOC117642044 isoform X3 n=1 Tax=Thrips palmi TaxID=161013 RepID=A0A6P8ZJP7_THRPL|nr:uncharacterized protein LOC117642044 isoform X3 [Thrips palmi]
MIDGLKPLSSQMCVRSRVTMDSKLLNDLFASLTEYTPSESEIATAKRVRQLFPAAASCQLILQDGTDTWKGEFPLYSDARSASLLRDTLLLARVDGTLKKEEPMVAVADGSQGRAAPSNAESGRLKVSLRTDGEAAALAQLRAVQGSLSKLTTECATAEALKVICSMPRLQDLTLDMHDDVEDGAPSVPPLTHSGGLVRLKTLNVARVTLKTLLLANKHSITDLHLCVGTPGGGLGWREAVDDLHSMLSACGLSQLRLLALYRHFLQHTDDGCKRQLRALRRALPRVALVCMDCHLNK